MFKKASFLTSLMLSPLMLGSLLMGAAQTAHANSITYDGRICKNCNYDAAKQIAQKIKPNIQCQLNHSGPMGEKCYSKTRYVAVKNATTGAVYGFYHGHNNQGKAEHELQPFISDIKNLPHQVDTMFTHIINVNDSLDEALAALEGKIYLDDLLLAQLNRHGMRGRSDIGCNSNNAYLALKAANNPRSLAKVQSSVQEKYDQSSKFRNSFTVKRYTAFGASAGMDGIGMNAQFEYLAKAKVYITKFRHEDTPGKQPINQVAYRASLVDNGASVSLVIDDNRTTFEGLTFHSLKINASPIDERNISTCLAEAIDETYEKTVTEKGGSAGGGFPNASRNNIRLKGYKGGSGPGHDGAQCKHSYYDAQGQFLFAFMGACP